MLRNLKHILFIAVLSIGLILWSEWLFHREFSNALNAFFTYRTGNGVWQDKIYTHLLRPSDNIAIIKIDNESINALQANGKMSKGNLKMLTIPKSSYISLIEKLEKAGVKGIAFDIIFENADESEWEFAKVLEKYKNIVIAAGYQPDPKCVKDQSGSTMNCSGVPRSVYKHAKWWLVNISSKDGIERPISESFLDMPYASWKLGTGKTIKASDGYLYSLPIAFQFAVLWLSGSSVEGQRFSELNPYFGPPGSYPSMSFIDALEMGRASTIQTFSWKYVFIGESGAAIHDSFTSPVSGTSMDGVEWHAHYLDGILQEKILFRISPDIQTGIVIFLAIFSILLFYTLPSLLSIVLFGVLPIAVIYLVRYTYDIDRTLIDIFPLLLASSILTYPVTYIYRFFIVDREKRQLKSNFAHYIDPRVVEQIVKKWGNIELGGEKRELSVLFSDIAGFTTISEKLDPRDLFYLMTAYLSNMTDILIKEWGTLDKYIWDAVMGFFGAPMTYEDHAIRAANTALMMRQTLPDFNHEIQKHGIEPIDFRVGIASGDVMVGNIGSHDRFNYTVLGDTVNLASRLEWTGKEYGVHIIISEKVKNALSPRFFTRELDTIAVKGKSEWIRIFELIGYSEDYVDRLLYINYEKALRFYRNDQYKEAGQIWQSQSAIDPPSRVMMLRCAEVLRWNITIRNGIYTMDHK